MTQYDYDLFTIGAGSGGVRASRVASSLGARVAVAEDTYLGGTCVNAGCVPKKLFVYASHYREDFEDAAAYGWSIGERRRFDWKTLLENKDGEIQRLNGVYARLLDAAGVERIEGRATLLDAHTVAVGEQRHTAATILVATGSQPSTPRIPGIELAITSDHAFHLERFPERVVVVGGGYIAVEFAGIFQGMGAAVTQLYRGPLFMRGFDDDVRAVLADQMRRKGIDLRFEKNLTAIERSGSGLRLSVDDGSTLEADQVLYATGRVPKTANLGLENAGVELGRNGAVIVDDFSRSSVPHIYAIGDCTDRLMFTPVAIAEAIAFANTVFAGTPTRPDHTGVPAAVFSQPPVGCVGLTEAEAREGCGEIDVYRTSFRPMKHTLTGRDETTMMKLIVERASDRVVGCHMVGPDAGEITQGLAIALKCGATKAQFDATIGIHPTAAEEFVTMREKLPDPGVGMKQIWIPRAGEPEVLELREAADPLPAAGEVRIRVAAAGVNFADIVARMGLYPGLPPMPVVVGYEAAGSVDAVGDGVESDWLGREVLALTRFGAYSDTVCVPERQVFTRPSGMSAEEGAALPVNYLTAYQLLEVMGGLRAGETLLVHSAGGGVGVAAIQLARRIGVTIIGTASSGKHGFLESIGVDHCVDYRSEDFEARVRQITRGRGVELAIDAVGGSSFKKSFRALAPTGRLGMFGMSAVVTGKKRSIPGLLKAMLATPWLRFTPAALMRGNKGVFGVNLGQLWEEMDRVTAWMETLLAYYQEGAIRPVVAASFPFERAAQAHHYIQDRKNLGKVLLAP